MSSLPLYVWYAKDMVGDYINIGGRSAIECFEKFVQGWLKSLVEIICEALTMKIASPISNQLVGMGFLRC